MLSAFVSASPEGDIDTNVDAARLEARHVSVRISDAGH
jgi:hypothetical protein